MGLTVAGFAAAAVAEIPQIFDDAIDTVQAGEADYLAEGTPSSIPGKLSQAAGRSACRIYGAGTVDLNPAAAARYERTCRPYLDTLQPGAGPTIRPEFQGGQCDCARYQVTYAIQGTSDQFGGSFTRSGEFKVRGPLGAPQKTNNNSAFSFTARSPRGVVANNTPPCGDPQSVQINFWGFPSADAKFTTFTVVPVAGDPNDCGNPPPSVQPPTRIPNPTGPGERFNPEPGIDVNINTSIDVDGRITVNLGTGPITVDPFGEDGGAGGGGGGGGIGEPGDAGAPVETGSGDPATGDGGDAEGEAPEGFVLTGVRVDVVQAPSSRVRYTPEVDRGVVYVYMGTAEGLGLETSGSMLRSGQFFFAQKDYLTKWAVRSRFGYNNRVTPYYREIPNGDTSA